MSQSTINYVLKGKYENQPVKLMKWKNDSWLELDGGLDKNHISSYTILDESAKNSSEYSFWKAALGVALFGGLGAVAGIGGKNKSSKEYLISIEWKNGEKSLIFLDDDYYKVFVKSMF